MSKSLDTKRTGERTSRSFSKPTKTRSTNSLTKEAVGGKRSAKSRKVSKSNITHSKDKKASKRSKKFRHISKSKTTHETSKTTHEASSSDNRNSSKKMKQPSQPLMPDNSKFDALKEEASYDRKQNKQVGNQEVPQIKANTASKTSEYQKLVEIKSTEIPADLIHAQLMDASKDTVGGAIPGENLQNALQHGEYLLDFPTLSISISFIELFFLLLGITLALVGTQAEINASYMLILNAILLILLLIALIVMQWRACHVVEELDLNDQVRYIIDPKARRYYAAIHLLRLMLICSTFSILAYYGACGDQPSIRQTSICKKISASKALLWTSASFFFLQLLLIIVHLVFYFRNRLSVRKPCTK